jgi:hypothetical protein
MPRAMPVVRVEMNMGRRWALRMSPAGSWFRVCGEMRSLMLAVVMPAAAR